MKPKLCTIRRFLLLAVSLSAALLLNASAHGQQQFDNEWFVDVDGIFGTVTYLRAGCKGYSGIFVGYSGQSPIYIPAE